jgi:hypothetical protein
MIGASCPAGPVRDIKRTAGQTEAQNRAHGAAIRVARLGCPRSDVKRPGIAHREHFRFWPKPDASYPERVWPRDCLFN